MFEILLASKIFVPINTLDSVEVNGDSESICLWRHGGHREPSMLRLVRIRQVACFLRLM